MSRHSLETHIEPFFGRGMPSYSQNMASFMGKPYTGAYFSFRPPGNDMSAFPVPWSSTESAAVDGQSPMSHGSDRKHIYGKDGRPDEGLPAAVAASVAASVSKRGFTRFTPSPEPRQPQNTASVIVRKDSCDRAVYLGAPHAVYRHGPCSDLCCVMGLGSPPQNPKKTVYNHSWNPGESDPPLAQHRPGPAETVRVSVFSPQRNLSYPSVIEPVYSPSKVKEVRPRAYPGFYPSHSAYEPLIYHNTSPVSKYGQTLQHPAFYYPPAGVDLEPATESRDSVHKAKIPVIMKPPVQPAGDPYVPHPRRDATPNGNFLQGFEYPAFLAPRLNMNHGHRHPHAEFASHRPVHSPVGYRRVSEEHSSKSVCREQTSPSTCARNSAPHPLYAFSPPRAGAYTEPQGGRLHVGPPAIHAPPHLNLGVESSKHSGYHVLLHPKHPHVSPPHPASAFSHNVQKILYCPPRASPTFGGRLRGPQSPVRTRDEDDVFVVESVHKRRRTEQRNESTDVSPPLPVINNVFSLAPYRTQMSRLQSRLRPTDEDVKPQIIASKGVLRIPVKDIKPPPGRTEPESFSKDRGFDSAKAMVIKTETFEQTLRVSDNIEPGMSRAVVQVKQERLEEPEHTCAAVTKSASGSPRKVDTNQEVSEFHELLKIIKKEPEEVDLDMDLQQRSLEVKHEWSEGEDWRPVGESGQKSQEKEGTPRCSPAPAPSAHPAPFATPLPGVRPNFLNIPPQCLKLSTYNIICPDANLPRSVHKAPKLPEPPLTMPNPSLQTSNPSFQTSNPSFQTPNPSSQTSNPSFQTLNPTFQTSNPSFQTPNPSSQTSDPSLKTSNPSLQTSNPSFQTSNPSLQTSNPSFQTPNLSFQTLNPSFQMPVRKHFLELHQSLVKLVSKSVAATSEDTLRSWLSQMQLSPVASGKTQRVRCLLGAEGRAACLNEEMVESLQQVCQRMNEYSHECCPFPFVVRTGDVFLPILVVKEVLFSSVQGSLIDQVLQEHRVELRPTTLSEEKTLVSMNRRAGSSGSSRLRRLMSYKHFPAVYADAVNLLYYSCVCKQLGSESGESPEDDDEPRAGGRSSDHEDFEELQTQSLIRRRSRIKRSSRLMFLDCSSDDEEPNGGPAASWMCPLTSEELPADATEGTLRRSFEPSVARPFQEKPKKRSGVVLKLRRTFERERTSYKPVLESEKLLLDGNQSETAAAGARRRRERTPKVAKWKRLSFSNSLRPLNVYTKRKMRSLLTIKYCPFLSACHSADYRRRWVLRSAVQRARRAMNVIYPDLVGKTVRHLYEEDDKSEVWYRGEVLGVHKAHPDPLKTVFEVRYDSEPEWKYYLELLTDYRKGWLKVEGEAADDEG